ncbi:hypothetical protein H0H81_003654 [Sphagnurus paluster]|uniref:Uncharacterized protein n=1 Tax=Sphagnurus paluster TaxID=117069 RepID=A0A9P7FLT0_9AGAR|nr:hypothetical protein H0H81_003654 [Sphagnurus paluster]
MYSAVALIDPGDALAHHAVVHPKNQALNSSSAPTTLIRVPPYRHFRNITNCSCLVCRINFPSSSAGLAVARKYIHTPYLRTVNLCREHNHRPVSFCGLCLRATPSYDPLLSGAHAAAAAQHESLIGVLETDDKDAFPNVLATCRTCRIEWLLKRASDPGDREALGGARLAADDWETRSAVEAFVELAEGTIKDVLQTAREKLWLRQNTRLHDMLQQALAASRFNSGRGGYEDEEEEEEEEDDEVEIMQNEEAGARELALGDWARARILDGHWLSPADAWYNYTVPGQPTHVRAVHPCPWTRDASSFGSTPPPGDEEDVHPRAAVLSADIPPTYLLCEQAFIAHQRQLKVVLIAAMRNLVRKIVIECQTPGLGHGVEDPAIRAAKMTIEDVLKELREEEGLWFDGFDWVERQMNDQREREKKERDAVRSTAGSDDSSTSSNGSRSSNGTSPVLSTTTLQTTPSPPPIPSCDDKGEETSSEVASPIMISVAPVLDPPKLLRPIPYIPITAAHFPMYTTEALKAVWREACAPLYHCRCSICMRAAALANATKGPPTNQAPPSVVPTQVPQSTRAQPIIELEEVCDVDGEGEDEIELLEDDPYDHELELELDENDLEAMEHRHPVRQRSGYEDLEYVSASSETEDDEGSGSDDGVSLVSDGLASPSPPRTLAASIVIPRPRKRSSDELESTLEQDLLEVPAPTGGRGSTPPKRARTGDRPEGEHNHHHHQHHLSHRHHTSLSLSPGEEAQSPRRMRKRSSEELEEVGDESVNKKIKVTSNVTTPTSVAEGAESPPPTSDHSRPSSVSLSASEA